MNLVLDLKDIKYSREFFDQRPSRGIPLFTFIVLAILGAGFAFAAFMQMDDVIKANAILRPVGTISTLRSISGGQIKQKSYAHGMVVRSGDPLWQIDAQADLKDLENSRNLVGQIDSDARDLAILLQTVREDRNAAKENDSQAWTRSASWIGERESQKQRAEQVRVKLDRERAMPTNMASPQKIADLEAELMNSKMEIDNARSRQIIKCEDDIKALQQNRQTLERRISDLERKIKDATVSAPIAGRIDEIRRVNVGDYLMAGEEILKIVPQDGESIKAELQVNPSDIARIMPGQKVSLRFPALPPSDFGQLTATISVVPADVSAGPGNTAVFLVEAEIANPSLTAPNGERIQLRAGMGAQARVKLSRQTVLRMLLHKLDFIDKAN